MKALYILKAGVVLPVLLLSVVVWAQAERVAEQERPDGLQTVTFYSEAIGRQSKYDIVLPPDYEGTEQRYPVLYLLHGYMQNYTVWGRNLGAAALARELGDLIVVMPDAGNSWYVNYASSADGEQNDWEDFIIHDLLAHVDANFPTINQREGRAVAGLSMGGYGALLYGLKYPELFVSVASTSGSIDFARNRAEALETGESPAVQRAPSVPPRMAEADAAIAAIIDIPGFSHQPERTPPGILFETTEQARANDPFQLLYTVPRSRLPHFYLDVGNRDNLAPVTREFAQTLIFNAVPVDFMQAEGGHDAQWWRYALTRFMPIQRDVMYRALENRSSESGQ